MDDKTKRPLIAEVIEGGPAARAGLKKGDVIEEIDGVGTDGLDVKQAVDRLRGAEGSQVMLRVRQPGDAEARVVTATRGTLPQSTVHGFRTRPDGSMDVLIGGSDAIGYLKIEKILGSTPHEFRVMVRRMEEEGAKALILDLRPVREAPLHPTVLLADALLESGTIGRVRSANRVETFRADSEAVFREGPIALLVNPNVPINAQWLAAALQDNRRANVVGVTARRRGRPVNAPLPPGVALAVRGGEDDSPEVRTPVPVGDGSWSIVMATGRLERGNGRPLARYDEDPGGLVPDIRAAWDPTNPAASPPGGPPAEAENTPETDPNIRGDPVLIAALRRLRTLLRQP
jgi:carboxyl-terminal processing protease